MKILILSFYFTPDLCAGAFRVDALVHALVHRLPRAQLDVVSTRPNRYQSFSAEAPRTEQRQGLRITRIALPSHSSGMRDQSRAFLRYYRETLRVTRSEAYDLVIGTSSRLMTAVLAAKIARRNDALLYLDIRDIFVDTIGDVLPPVWAAVTKPSFSILERWAFNAADKINIVSRGFEPYFRTRYPRQKLSFFSNGIDAEFMASAVVPKTRVGSGEITILYAGNIGEGQGLHHILPELASRMQGRARFRIIGDGGRIEALRHALAARQVDNVELLAPLQRDVLIQEYLAADVLFLHLNDYDAFRKVLPSKIFEYAALGKPILAGVAGYAAEFLAGEVDNSAVFPPCDAENAMRVFAQLTLATVSRPAFLQKFSREDIMRDMAADIVQLLEERLA